MRLLLSSAVLACVPIRLAAQPAPPATGKPEPVPAEVLRLEDEALKALNAARRKYGVAELQEIPELRKVARDYSRQMAVQGFFSHTSPTGQDVSARVLAAGIRFRLIGENLYYSEGVSQKRLVATAVNGWMNSAGHRANILRPEFTHTGLGLWRKGKKVYFTQVFIRPL